MNPARLLRYGAAAAGAGVLGFGAWSALAWARYGHVHPRRHPPDELLDRFLPDPEVDEYHQVEVRAPPGHHLGRGQGDGLPGRAGRQGHLLAAGGPGAAAGRAIPAGGA